MAEKDWGEEGDWERGRRRWETVNGLEVRWVDGVGLGVGHLGFRPDTDVSLGILFLVMTAGQFGSAKWLGRNRNGNGSAKDSRVTGQRCRVGIGWSGRQEALMVV